MTRRSASTATPTCPSRTSRTTGTLETMTRAPGRGSRSGGTGRCSTRAASASRATASRPPPGCSSTPPRDRDLAPDGYDVGVVQQAMEAQGLPERLVARLRTGCEPMIGGRRPISGRKPGDKRVRVERHHAPYFRYTGPNQLTAKAAASAPTTPMGRFVHRTKAILIGKPLANEEEIGERLSKKKALAIFSSDAISSSAYATEEILLAFLLAGVGGAAFLYSIQVSIGIAVLLGIVAFSYRQVCIAYPTGGGSYSVSKANIGRHRVAHRRLGAAHRLHADGRRLDLVRGGTDRVGVPGARPRQGGDRDHRDRPDHAGQPPRPARGGQHLRDPDLPVPRLGVPDDRHRHVPDPVPGRHRPGADARGRWRRCRTRVEASTILILLRAFASGAVALTGTEAIATGVPAFQPPEATNAARDADGDGPHPGHRCSSGSRSSPRTSTSSRSRSPEQTVISQISRHVYGDTLGFYLFQAFTALLLFLAANTSYNAFPRLGAVLAEDGFVPRQFAFRGDRLAYSQGIILLGVIAGIVVILGGGSTHALIPLYAVGVFIDFTIAQSGMVRHWLRTRDRAGGGGCRSTRSGRCSPA